MNCFRIGPPVKDDQGRDRWPVLAPNGEPVGVECGYHASAEACVQALNADPVIRARYAQEATA